MERIVKWYNHMLQLKDIFNLLGNELKNRSNMAITYFQYWSKKKRNDCISKMCISMATKKWVVKIKTKLTI